jgi:arsenite methyltransferase
MSNDEKLKSIVKDKYGSIAKKSNQGCGCNCSCSNDYSTFSEDYSSKEGYVAEADLGLGCGIPTEFAQLKKGETILDLGAGAGNDVFVARSFVGASGKVIGVDMTEEMVAKAKENQKKVGFENVDFRLGEIEKLPVSDNEVDVIISNCVLNLVPDKTKAFSEMIRVLKPGGRFCVSDIVLDGELPEKLKSVAELYAGCVSGASQKDDYINLLKEAGFNEVEIKKEQNYYLSDETLKPFLDQTDIDNYRKIDGSILSITVVGKKPS